LSLSIRTLMPRVAHPVGCDCSLLPVARFVNGAGLPTGARTDFGSMLGLCCELHHADTAVAHARTRPDLSGTSVSLGAEGAVPGVFLLIAAAPVAMSVFAVRALATMNYPRRGHEVLVHVPRAHDGIVEREMRYLVPDILCCRSWRGVPHSKHVR
jgi:hypothetical protein